MHRQTRDGRPRLWRIATASITTHVLVQIKGEIERTTRVAAWSAVQDRLLLVQRWQGTQIAKLNLPNKTPTACALRWKRFHAKVLDATMLNLPEHASSDFVAELSDLMSDHAWWDAVEEKHTELLNDRASDKAGAPPPPSTLLNILNPHSPPKPCRPRSVGRCGRRSSPGSSRSAPHPPPLPTGALSTPPHSLASQKKLLRRRRRSASRPRSLVSTIRSCSCSLPVSCACALCSSNQS